MTVNEQDREQAILDAAADLLCRFGYNKLTMGDVADAVDLHRGLVYLRFKSKDELVAAVLARELRRYADGWREHLESDPRGGSVASVYRAMMNALKTLPLAAAIVARDEALFGKYLRKPGGLFDPRRRHSSSTQEFLRVMQGVGAIEPDVDTRAMAVIFDALTPAVRRAYPGDRAAAPGDDGPPSSDDLLEAMARMFERALPPVDDAARAAGKAILLSGLDQAVTESGTELGDPTGAEPDDQAGAESDDSPGNPAGTDSGTELGDQAGTGSGAGPGRREPVQREGDRP
ncbi:TetR/AcrR family transcriptional regulator [Nonomuraea zeae]|uniref:TetR/AcrR family transcriptional regulator n=1 Tax=Nonomuraea zeae TaxID=1642303 RepID=A0A5S4F4L1_9ACTN|nr:TetR/AcrR family transcriptional regulator [Nonomuraea zeae]TMR11111.1 TetR/AcrR family transcriptional regulator [Nonomuraea zeae]